MGIHGLAPSHQPDEHRTCHPEGWQPGSGQAGHTEGAGAGHRPVTSQRDQKAEAEVRDPSAAPGRGHTAATGADQAGRQTDGGSQAKRLVARQAGRQTDRRPAAVSPAQGEASEQSDPRARGSLGREAGVGLSERGCLPGLVCRAGRKRRMWGAAPRRPRPQSRWPRPEQREGAAPQAERSDYQRSPARKTFAATTRPRGHDL